MIKRWQALRPGDRVRLLSIPEADVRQRDREIREGIESPGWTADTLDRIIALDPVVTIDHIDEYGVPWFDYELTASGGEVEYHFIAIMDDESWETT